MTTGAKRDGPIRAPSSLSHSLPIYNSRITAQLNKHEKAKNARLLPSSKPTMCEYTFSVEMVEVKYLSGIVDRRKTCVCMCVYVGLGGGDGKRGLFDLRTEAIGKHIDTQIYVCAPV